jgi:hypothetical protein
MEVMVNATLQPFLPGKDTRYPLYRRLGGLQGRSGRLRKISPPPEFDPWSVQPVVNRYINYAVPVHNITGYGPEELGAIPGEGRDLEIYLFATTAGRVLQFLQAHISGVPEVLSSVV